MDRLLKISDILDKVTHRISLAFLILGLAVLMLMVLMVVYDVFMRYAINRPLQGTYEGVEFLMVFSVGWGLAFAQREKRNVEIDMLTNRFGPRARAWNDFVIIVITFLLVCTTTWRSFITANDMFLTNGTSTAPVWPFGYLLKAPFYYAMALALVPLCLVLLLDVLNYLIKAVKR